jgi:hypothetical protein
MEEAVIAVLTDRRLMVEPNQMTGEIMVFFNFSCSAILDDYSIWEWSQFQ